MVVASARLDTNLKMAFLAFLLIAFLMRYALEYATTNGYLMTGMALLVQIS